MTFLQWLRAFVVSIIPARDLPTPYRPVPTPVPTGWRVSIVAAMNAERARHGLAPLLIDARLTGSAQRWAATMAASGVLAHSGDTGSRITAAGYRWVNAAENLAEGQPTPAAVVAAWMSDIPHRANVLGRYLNVGVGVFGPFVCADFASPA